MRKLLILFLLLCCSSLNPQSKTASNAHSCSQITATIAALNVLDKLEANYEVWPPHETSLASQVQLALNKVLDRGFRKKLEILTADIQSVMITNAGVGLEPDDPKAKRKATESIARYKSDRAALMDLLAP
jgi:hypothetical protein